MTRDERRLADMVVGAIIGYFVSKTLAKMEASPKAGQLVRSPDGRSSR